MRMRMTTNPRWPLERRFWNRVNRTDQCWLWTGTTGNGYGRIIVGRRQVQVHHVAWNLAGRAVPQPK